MKSDNDYELVLLAQEGNEDAINALYKKYTPIIVKKSKNAFLNATHHGIEIDDIIQECFVGFDEAIKNFSQNDKATFYTFSMICVERQISNYLRRTTRIRNKALNEAINIDDANVKMISSNIDIENDIIGHDYDKNIIEEVRNNLTQFEKDVLNMLLKGFSFDEIAKKLNKDKKAIYNTFQRIKVKFKKISKNDN